MNEHETATQTPNLDELMLRVRRQQEVIADIMIERRLDRARMAVFELQVKELEAVNEGIRRALRGREGPAGRGDANSKRRMG